MDLCSSLVWSDICQKQGKKAEFLGLMELELTFPQQTVNISLSLKKMIDNTMCCIYSPLQYMRVYALWLTLSK